MFKKFIYVFLIFSFFLQPRVATSGPSDLEDDDKEPFHLLFRAKDKFGKSGLFIPSEHGFPWDLFPAWFKDKVLSNQIAVIEKIENEETREISRRFVSLENLRHKDCFTENSWFFPEDHEKYQELYTKISLHFNEKGYDYSYLKDISHIKPGLLAYMNICIFNPYQSSPVWKEGMDSKIDEIFSTTQQKKRFALEDTEELISCFGLYSASYEDVKDDFSIEALSKYVNQLYGIESEVEEQIQSTSKPSFYGYGFLPANLQEALSFLENEMADEYDIKSLPTFDNSISKRNKVWMPKILDHIASNNASIMVGSFHFLGKEGLLALGQESGLQWQFFNQQGQWEDFDYLLSHTWERSYPVADNRRPSLFLKFKNFMKKLKFCKDSAK